MENHVDNCGKNVWITRQKAHNQHQMVHLTQLFHDFSTRFPLKNDEKRYKLVIFAPKTEFVNNPSIEFSINDKL